jgi:hypothetical protein
VLFSLASLLLLAGVAMAQEPANSGICDAAETVGQAKVRLTLAHAHTSAHWHRAKKQFFREQKTFFFSQFPFSLPNRRSLAWLAWVRVRRA